MQIFSERIFQKGGDFLENGVWRGFGWGVWVEFFFIFFGEEGDFLWFGWRGIGGNV
jgi:hypothetical protein